MVKELYSFGRDISAFVPEAIYKLMKGDDNEHETL